MLSRLCLLLLVIMGCAEHPPIPSSENFNPKTVSRIAFRIEQDQNSQLDQFESAQLNDVSQEISARFAAVGYPIKSAQEDATIRPDSATGEGAARKIYTHELKASAGTARLTETPSGFTLDFGNSDVRSQNFQKTTTVDIQCRLVDLTGKQEPIVLSERKAIPASVAETSAANSRDFEKVRSFYVENIGATCHDLLTKLDIYPSERETPNKVESQAWGAMRIQTDYEQDSSSKSVNSPKSTASPVKAATIPKPKEPGSVHVESFDTPGPQPAQLEKSVLRQPSSAAPMNRPVDVEIPVKKESAVLYDAPNQAALEDQTQNQESRASEASEDGGASSITTRENQTGDWRKKKITIFNRGNTVILKFGPDR